MFSYQMTRIEMGSDLARQESMMPWIKHPLCLAISVLAVCLGSLLLTACGSGESDSDKTTLAFVPKSREHSFWLAVIRGAERAAKENDVELLIQSATRESDIAMQIDVVNTLRTEGVDGLILAPLNDESLLRPVREFGTPVVIMDSPLSGEVGKDFASFVGTENSVAGRMAGETMAGILGDNKKIVLLRYIEGSASTTQREEGFLQAVSDAPDLEVISSNQYAGAGESETINRAGAMIDTIRQAGGIFTPNQPASNGMLRFLQDNDLAGKIRFIAFDASIPLIQGLVAGHVDAIIVQDPEVMGYNAVTTMLAVLNGESVEPHVDTGAVIVTRDNLTDPKVRAILLAYDTLIEPLLPPVSE